MPRVVKPSELLEAITTVKKVQEKRSALSLSTGHVAELFHAESKDILILNFQFDPKRRTHI
jgi:hypothetical protein